MASTINAITSGGGGIAVGGDTSGVIGLQSNGTTFATGNQYGIGLGTAVPSSGIGIAFPATQSASSDANTLDDYEEGSWTPTDGSGAGLTFLVNYAQYTKIGRLVTVQTYFEYPSTASGAAVRISGLPFTLPANGYATGALSTSAAQTAFVRGQAGNNLCILYAINGTGTLTNANFSTQFVIFSMTYQV